MRRWAEPGAVGLVVLAASVFTAQFALQVTQYVVMPDELGYVKAAVETSRDWLPVVPGDFWFNSWAQLHSIVLAPLYGAFRTTSAFDASHVVNAVLMASAAVPVYLTARAVTEWRAAALVAAALTVGVPWMALAGTALTETIAYPAFAWAVLAITAAIARPGPRSDALALLAIGVAFLARTQLAILGIAFLLAALAHELLHPEARGGPASPRALAAAAGRAVRRHAVAFGGAALALAAGVAAASDVLGNYEIAASGNLLPEGSLGTARDVLSHVVVGVGILPLPLAMAWAVSSLGRPLGRHAHAFACFGLIAGALLIVSTGAYLARFASGVNDRYLMYLAPLLFIGLAASTRARGRAFTGALLASGAWTAWLAGNDVLKEAGATLISPTFAFHQVLNGRSTELGIKLGDGPWDVTQTLPVLAAALVLVVAAGMLLLADRIRDRFALGVVAAVLAFCVLETGYTFNQIAAGHRTGPEFLENRDWVDQKLPSGARAAAILGGVVGGNPAAVWWDLGFWNKTVDHIYYLAGGDLFGQGFAGDMDVDPRTGRITDLDGHTHAVKIDTDTRLALQGKVVEARYGVVLVAGNRPWRTAWHITGGNPDSGHVPAGQTARMRLWRQPGQPARRRATFVFTAPETGAAEFAVDHGGVRREAVVRFQRNTRVSLALDFGGRGYADVTFARAAGDGPPLQFVGFAS